MDLVFHLDGAELVEHRVRVLVALEIFFCTIQDSFTILSYKKALACEIFASTYTWTTKLDNYMLKMGSNDFLLLYSHFPALFWEKAFPPHLKSGSSSVDASVYDVIVGHHEVLPVNVPAVADLLAFRTAVDFDDQRILFAAKSSFENVTYKE